MAVSRFPHFGFRLFPLAAAASLPLLLCCGCGESSTQQVSAAATAKLSGEPAPSDQVNSKIGGKVKNDGTIKGRLRGGQRGAD